MRRLAAPAELRIIDVIAEHDVEAAEEFAGEGDPGFGPAPPVQDGKVAPPEMLVRARGERGRLSEDPAQQRVPLLGDFAEVVFGGRGVDRGR